MNNEMKVSDGWGYWDYNKKKFLYVFPHRYHVELCSPDFFKSDIEAGLGDILPVTKAQDEEGLEK